MTSSQISSAVQTSTTGGSTVKSTSTIDQEGFMKLLVTQLSNQDPINPMSTEESISQLTQFSSLDELTSMNSNIKTMNANIENIFAGQSISQASALIGKTVEYVDSTSNSTVSGVVSKIVVSNAVPYLMLDGNSSHLVSLFNISGVKDTV
jgi:flagellar basal-body rod modification protein FlgD